MVSLSLFDLTAKHIVITGAAGLLGCEFARSLASAGAVPILLDIDETRLNALAAEIHGRGQQCVIHAIDVTDKIHLSDVANEIQSKTGPVWGIVNNVASNPPLGKAASGSDRLESFSIDQWNRDIALGLSSALLCSQIFGEQLAQRGSGSIVNIASDLAIMAPDQRIYRQPGVALEDSPVKPVSYSVVKAGMLGLTRYLATYWSPLPIRCNALLPGSVQSTQSASLVAQLEARIPLARLATTKEYCGALIFLLSDASAYMTGSTLIMDGGRTIW